MVLQVPGKMYRPTDVAVDIGNDTVYVVEHFNHRISKWNYTAGGFTFTLDAGQVTTLNLGNVGSGYVAPTLVFSAPDLDIADPVTATGTIGQTGGMLDSLVLTDGGNGYSVAPTVTVVDSAGVDGVVTVSAINAPWGSNGDGTSGEGAPVTSTTDNALYRPTGIIFEGSRLTVTDTFHHRIRTLSPTTGAFLNSVGQGGTGTTDFYRPAGIATNGIILVIADEFNHRAVKYLVGDPPTVPVVLPVASPLTLNRPHGVVFDVTNNLFNVTDSVRGIINNYNVTATIFNSQFGTPGTTGTDLFFPGSGHGLLTGTTTTAFADTRNNEIKTVANTTIVNTTNTTSGSGDGQLYWPESVNSFADGANYVLAANTRNHRIEAYSNATTTLAFEDNFGTPFTS